MSENSGQNSLLQQPAAGWRLKLGIIIFMLSIILPVHGELILRLLREAGIALGSEPANGSCSMWVAV
jgi:hypothetical protein